MRTRGYDAALARQSPRRTARVPAPRTPRAQRCIKEECPAPSLRHVLALLRLANHDAEVFAKFKGVLIDKAAGPGAPDNTQRDVRGDVDRVYAAYYPLTPAKDTCFELGRVLMSLRDYATAVEFFNKSTELCGAHHVTWCVRGGGGGRGAGPRLLLRRRAGPRYHPRRDAHNCPHAGTTRVSACTTCKTTTARWTASRCGTALPRIPAAVRRRDVSPRPRSLLLPPADRLRWS